MQIRIRKITEKRFEAFFELPCEAAANVKVSIKGETVEATIQKTEKFLERKIEQEELIFEL